MNCELEGKGVTHQILLLKCGPRTSSNSIAWELVRNVASQTLPPTV